MYQTTGPLVPENFEVFIYKTFQVHIYRIFLMKRILIKNIFPDNILH